MQIFQIKLLSKIAMKMMQKIIQEHLTFKQKQNPKEQKDIDQVIAFFDIMVICCLMIDIFLFHMFLYKISNMNLMYKH